jgi:hypothetical protein
MSNVGNKRVGSYTSTVVYCWSWIGKPSQYTIKSTKRSATWKIEKDQTCGNEVFGRWAGDPRRSADAIKKRSAKTWDSTQGHIFLRNYFLRTFADEHKCTFKFQGQLTWKPQVVLRLTLPKPSVLSARAAYPLG